MPEGQNTWERLRASRMDWKDILREIRIPHMALLRNLRGICSEVKDIDVIHDALEDLKRGVKNGKQFPFRYLSAMRAVENANIRHIDTVKHAFADSPNIRLYFLNPISHIIYHEI